LKALATHAPNAVEINSAKWESPVVRYKMTSAMVLSVLVLTASHATGIPPVTSASNPQTTEAKAQETVDLKISGMT
jgi:hypothetical protein